MKTFKELLQDLQDVKAEINNLKYKINSLNNQSEIIRLNYLANDVINLIDLNYKEEYNKL